MATLYYDLMDRYGHTTRSELLGSLSADEAWEKYLKMHTGLKYFDETIEASADYRDKSIIMPAQVWKGIAEIEHYHGGNVNYVLYAKSVMKQEQRRDRDRAGKNANPCAFLPGIYAARRPVPAGFPEPGAGFVFHVFFRISVY